MHKEKNTLISSRFLEVQINHHGAEMVSVKNHSGLEYLWSADKEVWPRHAPVLFPIVGKLKDDRYAFADRHYAMPQHGFARDMDFELLEQETDTCTFELRSNNQTLKIFPFEFVLLINYRLLENRLFCSYTVTNPSDLPLFFSLGAHPGFKVPVLPGQPFEDYFFEMENERFEITELENGLRLPKKSILDVPGKKLFLNSHLFEKDALVFEGGQISTIALRSKHSPHAIQLDCPGWPSFGLWSKKANTQFVCMEPWFGIADAQNTNTQFTEKQGVIRLHAQAEHHCSYTLTFT